MGIPVERKIKKRKIIAQLRKIKARGENVCVNMTCYGETIVVAIDLRSIVQSFIR